MVSRETLVEGNHVKVSDMYLHLVAHPEPFRGRERSVPAQSASCPKYLRVLSESAIGCSAGQSSQNVRLGRQIIIIRTQYLIYATSESQAGKKIEKAFPMLRYQFGGHADRLDGSGSRNSTRIMEDQIEIVRQGLIGSVPSENDCIISPLDKLPRQIVYADYTASGRSLQCIENFIQSKVLPWYANTHSVASGTARQSTYYREESRNIIRNYFNCTEANAVIFAGAGVTGAVSKFLAIVEEASREGILRTESGDLRSFMVEDRWGSLMCSLCNVRVKNEAMYRSHCDSAMHNSKASEKQSVISGPTRLHFLIDSLNHHSSMLPFREAARRNPSFISFEAVSRDNLCVALERIPKGVTPVAIMCAMSNITGEGPDESVIFDVNETIHERGGIVAWDLATYACHHRFDMNPSNRPRGYTDFGFVSTHKLVGGPGAVGLLLARREWLKNKLPTVAGGGVVFFASTGEESYIQNSEEREEAGTPDILGCIRAGLVFSLHSRLGMKQVAQHEVELSNRLRNRLLGIDNIHILGADISHSPIISFNIRFDKARMLHHNFVAAVLNDLFGIQGRGGCACAGPYAQKLLGLSEEVSHDFHLCLQQSGQEIFRPGFVRLGIHWTMTAAEVDAIADAVCWIAENGWRVLSVYTVDIETGEWKHRLANHDSERDWISAFDFFACNSQDGSSIEPKTTSPYVVKLSDLIEKANIAMARMHEQVSLDTVKPAALDSRFADLVWFAQPIDAKNALAGGGPDRIAGEHSRLIHPTGDTPVDVKKSPILVSPAGNDKKRKFQVPKKLRALVTSAIKDYSMIKEGDRILIGISGGKDSLSLLHILLDCQRKCPFRFEIACATVDPQTPEYQPQALIGYMESLGVKYHYLSSPIVELAKTAMTGKQSICAFCSRMKRGMLYGCMRQNGYNVLALGQHLDDLAESFLMSCFRNGCLSTMKANYVVKEKDLRVIRPLIYVREKMTDEFSRNAQLPVIRDNCPACFSAPKERHRIKMLLSNEEYQNTQLFFSMLQAMRPIMGISPAMSTRQLVERKMFPIRNSEEEDDQGAEEILLPCSEGSCPIP